MVLVRFVFFLALAGVAVWYFLAEPDRQAALAELNGALEAEADLQRDALTATLDNFELATVLAARSTPVAALVEVRPEPAETLPNAVEGTGFGQPVAPPATAESATTEAQALDDLRALEALTGLDALRVLRKGTAETLPPADPPANLLADGRWQAAIDTAFQGGLGEADFTDDQGDPMHLFVTPYFSRTGIPAVVIAEAQLAGVQARWGASDFDLALTGADGNVILSNAAGSGSEPIVVRRDIPAIGAVLTVAADRPEPFGPWAIRSAGVMLIAFLALLGWELNLARNRLRRDLAAARMAEAAKPAEAVMVRNTVAQAQTEYEKAAMDADDGENAALFARVAEEIGQELNRPLSAIRNHAEVAARAAAGGEMEAARDNIRHVSGLADRIWRTISTMRGFVPEQPYQLEPVSIRPLVHSSAVEMLEHDPALGDFFFMEEADDLPSKTFVRADKTRLTQVIDSLLSSCWDACRDLDGPELVISLRQSRDDVVVAIDYGGRAGTLAAEGGGRVSVGEVADTAGPVGAGIGFSIAKSVVEGMGGRLVARDTAHGGGRVEMFLPKFRKNTAQSGG